MRAPVRTRLPDLYFGDNHDDTAQGAARPEAAIVSTDPGLNDPRTDAGGWAVWRRWPAGGRLPRRLLWAGLALLVLVALGVGAPIGWLLLRLSEGPIQLSGAEHRFEAAVAERLGAVSVDVGSAFLVADAERDIVIRLDDVVIKDGEGKAMFQAPQAIVGTRLFSAAFGDMVPTSIELVGPQIQVRRRADGVVSLGFAEPQPILPGSDADDLAKGDAGDFGALSEAAAAPEGPAFSPLAAFSQGEEAGGLAGIKQLLIRDARLTVYDEASHSVWESFDARLRIHHPGTGLDIALDAPFTTASGEWRLKLGIQQVRAEEPFLARAEFDNVVPAEIAARMDVLADLAGFDMPVTGRVAAEIAPEGELRSVDLDLRLGAGFLRGVPRLGAAVAPVLVDEGRLVGTYERAKARLTVDRFLLLFGQNRIEFTGSVGPEFDADGILRAARFDLRTETLRLAAQDMPRAPVVVRKGLASGRVELDPTLVELDTVSLELDQGRVTIGGQLGGSDGTALKLNGRVEDLDADGLVQLWPGPLARGARAWIANHIPAGRIAEGRIDVDLTDADLDDLAEGKPIAEEAVDIDFRFAGVTADYLKPLPPIVEGEGSAHLGGGGFRLTLDRGAANAPSGERMAVTSGHFTVPTLATTPGTVPTGNIAVSIAAPTNAALETLDLKPLGFAREIGIEPATVGGSAQITIGLELPLRSALEYGEVRWQAGANLDRLKVPNAFAGFDLAADKLQILGTDQDISAEGEVRLNGVPAAAEWQIEFAAPGRRRNRLTMQGELDAADLARLGIPLGELVQGRARMDLRATGENGAFDLIDINAELSEASIALPAVGWRKETGASAELKVQVEPLDNQQIRLKDIRLTGEDLEMTGAIRLDSDGSLFKVDIDRLRIGPHTDIALTGQRGEDGVLRLQIRGDSFDARRMLERVIAGEEPEQGDRQVRPTDINFDIATVRGRYDTDLANATGVVRLREGEVNAIGLKGAFAGSRGLDLNFGLGSGESPAVVRIETQDAGGLVRFLGVYARAHGGAMSVHARGPDSRRLAGTLSASGFRVIDEPLLARIVATQPGMPSGAARDVTFSRLRLEFARDGGRLTIRDALIAAPQVGASMRGQVDLPGERLGLSGTYVPAYGLNAAFGAIPLVGPLLAGRSGEGVLGMTYGVNGPMSNPTITVNPLSAIAPGLLRRFFEFRQQENLSTGRRTTLRPRSEPKIEASDR